MGVFTRSLTSCFKPLPPYSHHKELEADNCLELVVRELSVLVAEVTFHHGIPELRLFVKNCADIMGNLNDETELRKRVGFSLR